MSTLREIMDVIGVDGAACVIAGAAAASLVVFITPTVRHFAIWLGVLDEPGPRRVHKHPVARLGGLGVLIGIVGGSILGVSALGTSGDVACSVLCIGAGVCLLGAIDDRRPISPGAKILGLVVAGCLLALTGVSIEFVHLPGIGTIEFGWFALPATVVWVLACSNAVNLVDGVDGAATGVVHIGAFTMALFALGTGDPTTAVLFSATCGASGAFLVYNRHPAIIFLGDSGSLLLGFMLAATSAAGCSKSATALIVVGTLVVLAVPFLDTTNSFMRRFRAAHVRGKFATIFTAIRATAVADKEHIHHRLLVRGLSHHRVSFILHVVTATVGVAILLLVPHGTVHWGAALIPLGVSALAMYRLAALKTTEKVAEVDSQASTVEIPYADDRDNESLSTPPSTPSTQPPSIDSTVPEWSRGEPLQEQVLQK